MPARRRPTGWTGVDPPGLLEARDVPLRDEPLRVEHGQCHQRERSRRHHPRRRAAGPQPEYRDYHHKETGAQPQLARQHQQPQHGEAVRLLVEPHPAQRGSDDHQREARRRAEEATFPGPLEETLLRCPAGAEHDDPEGRHGHREQLPEPAAGVLRVGQPGGPQHVGVRAEERHELHTHEQGEPQDQQRCGQGPLKPPEPRRAHPGRCRRRHQQETGPDEGPPAEPEQDRRPDPRTVHGGHQLVEHAGESGVCRGRPGLGWLVTAITAAALALGWHTRRSPPPAPAALIGAAWTVAAVGLRPAMGRPARHSHRRRCSVTGGPVRRCR